ncbi:MAG: hypothetical protein HYV42_03515 [Candidatus Magasanikbacteria bacterium]|nr:hypothetical protein [Candidatus Magasanikbacteria bacterium]
MTYLTKHPKKTAQEIQDDIFRAMSADRKLEVGAQLWRLAKALVGDKIDYGKLRSAAAARSDR